MNTNPAGLARVEHQHLDLYGAIGRAMDVRHRDALGNDAEVDNKYVGFGTVGYAHRLRSLPVTLGIGVFGQGGAGYEYSDIATAFGTLDRMTSLFRIAKLSAGLSYRVGDSWMLGLSVAAIYSDIEQELFPEASVFTGSPETSFFGLELTGADGVDYGFKLGMIYEFEDGRAIGVTYTSEADLVLGGGRVASNQSSISVGPVIYREAEVTGLGQPRELGIGYAWRAAPAWTLAVELDWIDWSSAIARSTLHASDPDTPTPLPVLSVETVQDWRDQYVIAVGGARDIGQRGVLRFGYNYGRNPIPPENLTPLLPAIAEHHLTFGYGWELDGRWSVNVALEYVPEQSVRYTNPKLPFGPEAEEQAEVLNLHVTVSRRW